jgi:hypothetical protein
MIAAYLRAELLRALTFLPWLLGLHALSLGMQTVWSAEASRLHESLVNTALWLVTAGCAVASVWRDHPRRTGAFLLSRPARILPLFAGKATGLLIWIGLPFFITELIVLRWEQMPPVVLWLGPLQMFLTVAVPALVLFPVLWFWRNGWQAITGLSLALAAGILLRSGIDAIPSLRLSGSSLLLGRFTATPSLLVASAGLALLLAAISMTALSRKFLPRWLAFTTALSAVILALTGFAHREPAAADSGFAPTLVHATLSNREERQMKARTWLSIEPPVPDLAPEEDIAWDFEKLRFNGEKTPPWPRRALDEQLMMLSSSLAMREAVRQHFQGRVSFPTPPGKTSMAAITVLPGEEDPTRSIDIETGLRGSVIRWEVVADLPIKEGATVESQGYRWTIEGSHRYHGVGFQFRESAPNLWLTGNTQALPGWSSQRFLLIDEEKGEATRLDASPDGFAWRYPGRVYRERSFHCRWSPHSTEIAEDRIVFKPTAGSYRLVVVRAFPVRTIATSWKPSRPLHSRGLWTPADRVARDQPADPREGTANAWLKENPTPGPEATEAQVSAWLGELTARVGTDLSKDKERNELRAAFASLMPAHFMAVTKAFESLSGSDRRTTNARHLFYMCLYEGMTEDLLRDYANDEFSPIIYEIALQKKIERALIPIAAVRVHQGFGWEVEEALLADPEATGLSASEWRDFFRLYPTGEAFRALAGKVIPRAEAEAEADRALKGYQPEKFDHDGDALLVLALARGRSEAPHWLKSAITGSTSDELRHSARQLAPIIRDSFSLPDGLKSEMDVVNWYLAQDPDRFVFDPATGKFQIH